MTDQPPFDPTTPLSRDATTPHSGRTSEEVHRFRQGEVIAGRYRIVRVAGIGGMGVVYEVEDLELGERVALKTLHAGPGAGEQEVARLRREAQLSRRVTHPNVCRIYDAGRHGEIIFVTMELLEGETLSEHIIAHGRLAPDVAANVLRQICAGLQAAHDAGVIHRDFKSGNVMLVTRGSDTRAVITDFGLARQSGPALDAFASHGRIAGTPAYMAPEQIQGAELTPAVDIYALGVVAFELVTGETPFRDTSLPGLVRRLHEPPPTPRDYFPEIDARWESLIVRCLQRDPAERFASAADVASALDRDAPTPFPEKKSPSIFRTHRLAMLVILALLIATAVTAFIVMRREPLPPVAAATKPARRAVAILGFSNLSQREDAEWLSTALAEMLATELAAAESLRVIPGEEIARAKRDLGLGNAASHASPALAKFRGATGADVVVLGSYVALPDKKLRLDLRIQSTTGGDVAESFESSGSEEDLFALIARTGAELRTRLGADARLAEGLDLRRGVPLNTEAARFFAEGVARMRAFDAIGARDALERAVAADPQFALAYGELSDAYAFLGYDDRAAAVARRAVEISGGLPRGERVQLDAKYHQRAHRLKEAIELYRSLVVQFPDDPDHRVRLVTALIDNSSGEEALAEVMAMRRLKGPYGLDPRVDLLEAWSAEIVGDQKRMLESSDRAIAKARAANNRDVVAEALASRGSALGAMARMNEALTAFDEAEELFAASGNRAGVAKSLRKRSFISWRRGELDEARRLNERALKIYRDVGQQLGAASSTGGIGVILNSQGDHTGARERFTEALEIYRRIGDRANTAWALSSIAGTHLMQNRIDLAVRGYEEALAMARAVGDNAQAANTLVNLGIAHSLSGDLSASERSVREALALFAAMGDRSSVASAETELGKLALRRGDLRAARVHQERAMKDRREIGERGGVAENQEVLAEIELEEGNAANALAQATAAGTEYEAEARPADRVRTMILASRANRALGRAPVAREIVKAARRLTAEVQDPEVAVELDLEEARLDGDIVALRRIVARTEREKLVDTNFSARLALAEAELRAGRRESALNRAEALVRDANARGYGLVAKRAGALR